MTVSVTVQTEKNVKVAVKWRDAQGEENQSVVYGDEPATFYLDDKQSLTVSPVVDDDPHN